MKQKTKVVEYIWTLNDGGAEMVVKDYALNLDKNLFDVVIVVNVINRETAIFNTLKENRIKIIPIYKKWNLLSKVGFKLFGKKYIPYKLAKIIEVENPQCIHCHLSVLKYVEAVSNKIKSKLFYTCHSDAKRNFKDSKEKEAAKKLIINNNMQLIALHEDMKKQLDSMFDVENTVVVRNGINVNKFKESNVTKDDIRNKINIPLDAFVIGNVARFSSVKNHRFLVDVFKKIRKINGKAYLFLIGNGELKDETVEYIRKCNLDDCVTILSERNDINELLHAMDVFVMPSKMEGLGIAFIEAQLSGIRCVGSSQIPYEAIISNNVSIRSLDDNESLWIEDILKYNESDISIDYDKYSLEKTIEQVEKLYLKEGDSFNEI